MIVYQERVMKILTVLLLVLLPLHAQSGAKIVDAARKQIGVTTDYVQLDFPNGDVPRDGGGAQEEDALTAFPLTGHYRWK